MSLGFTCESEDSIPSTRISGLPEFRDTCPRIFTLYSFPSMEPLLMLMTRDGSAPWRACAVLVTGLLFRSLPLMTPTAPVRFTFFWTP